MESTYFEILPTELLCIIAKNLSMLQILKCKIIGINIDKTHRRIFENKISEDFGSEIKLDLISYDKDIRLQKYNSCLNTYKSVLLKGSGVNLRWDMNLVTCIKLSLDMNLMSLSRLLKLGLSLTVNENTLKKCIFYVKEYFPTSQEFSLIVYDINPTTIYTTHYVKLSFIKNLLFFFGTGSIFTMK